jgi:hypothetical protein
MRVWRFSENDVEKAVQMMAKEARGKYVAQFFSDDYWEPENLMKQVTALENNPDYLVSATWAVLCDENLDAIEDNGIFIQKNRSRTEWIRKLLDGGNCLSAPSIVVKRDMFMKMCKSTSGAYQTSDWCQWIMLLKETNICMVEEVLTKNRQHKENANISLLESDGVQIRLLTEYAIKISQIIDEMSDEDFVAVYGDMMVDSASATHLEIICEKFFVLMKKCGQSDIFEESVLRYFYKYYSYEENGVYVSDVLRQKYNYSRTDFKDLSSDMGYVCEVYKRKKLAQQQD